MSLDQEARRPLVILGPSKAIAIEAIRQSRWVIGTLPGADRYVMGPVELQVMVRFAVVLKSPHYDTDIMQ
jgi:hypothetical protein